MCLDVIFNRYLFARNRRKTQIGYKWFRKENDFSPHIYYAIKGDNLPVPFNTVLKSSFDIILSSHDGYYRAGFHINKTIIDARLYGCGWENNPCFGLYKVEYSHVVADGLDNGAKVVIARRMKVLEEVK